MSTVYPALGTTLSVAKVVGTYTVIGGIESIDGPSASVGKADTTNLASATKTSRPTLADGGEVSCDLQFDPSDANQKYLRGLLAAPAIVSWQISYPTLPTPTLDTFEGYLTEFKPKAGGAEENLNASVTIVVNGLPVTTP